MLVAGACALAAPARADFRLWSEVGASAEVAEGLRIGFDQELRLEKGASEIDCVRPGVHAAWRAARWLSLRVGYRYEIEPHYTRGADYADGWHEGSADATLRQKLDRLRLSLRLRLEEKRGRPWDADGALVRSRAARQRLELEWPLWRALSVVGSGELFLALSDPDGLLDKWRAGAGLEWSVGAHELSLRYLLERPLTAGAGGAHVLGLSCRFAP